MADYTVTPANVIASDSAIRLIPDPAWTAGGLSIVNKAGATITAGQPVYKAGNGLFYPADATPIAAQTSGSLVVGRRYIITTFVAGDNFTNVGAASNATGVIFTATGTTPTTWTNASTLNDADEVYEVVGIAENGASAGQPVSIVEEDPNFTPGCTMAIGDTIILSATRGGISPSTDAAAGWRVSVLMVAISTTQVELKITRSDVAKV